MDGFTMSVGHVKRVTKTTEELYLILGEADTSAHYAKPVKLDTSHDIPYAGGVSVDSRMVYIDRRLYDDVKAGKVCVRGMGWKQIINCFVEHEHTEKSVDDGDNPVDVYQAAHGMATAKEYEAAEAILGKGKADRYEDALEGALAACEKRDPANPPKDLWCGPYLDEPTARDKELLRIFKAKGVTDAFKLAKSDPTVMYRMAGRKCEDCAMYEHPGKDLSTCELVCGLVRNNRQCERYVSRETKGRR
jgi:hypothetical protein